MFLNCHTHFSFKFSTLSISDLVAQAHTLGVQQLALTDIHYTSAALDFLHLCRQVGIHATVGVEFRDQSQELQYIGLARSHIGFQALNETLTLASELDMSWPETLCLPEVVIIYPWERRTPEQLGKHEYIGLRATECQQVRKVPHALRHKLVALHPVTLKCAEDWSLHRVLRSIDQNLLLSQLDDRSGARPDDVLISSEQLRQRFQGFDFLVDQAGQLLQQCHLKLNLQGLKNKKHYSQSSQDDSVLLRKLVHKGFANRYPEPPLSMQDNRKKWQLAKDRLERELEVIARMGFTANYLIVWDIIGYAEKQGYHWVGRGSAANSIVAYCLRITDVDPIATNLLFERFINLHRAVPPDFDIDFSWDERDDVLGYIFKRYGKGQVTFLSTYNRFKQDSALREVAKTYGLPKREIDRLVDEPNLTSQHHPLANDIKTIVEKLIGLPSHLSMHAGGILITEESLCHYTALQMMPKGFPVSHFDMHTAEEYHFYKFDILSQRGLGHIKMGVDFVRQNRGEIIDIHQVQDFFQDKRLLENLRSGRAIGCFYIESPAMRQLLQKLKCSDYPTLVAASSVIRPGVSKSGMMTKFIERHLGLKPFEYPHPIFEKKLKETYGVMIYQE
ncbi:MAG: PHP domain-containing protein, partial [Bacteroidota bacterium]